MIRMSLITISACKKHTGRRARAPSISTCGPETSPFAGFEILLPDTGPGSDFSLHVASTCFQQPCSLARLGSRSAGSGCPCACTSIPCSCPTLVSFSLIGGEEVPIIVQHQLSFEIRARIQESMSRKCKQFSGARSYGLWCVALSLPLRCKHCSTVMEGPGTGVVLRIMDR